ncbi:MAG: hypothetical protein ACK56W_15500 [Pirellula sp.]|nr:hypothetical protein [Pirellula sp.]
MQVLQVRMNELLRDYYSSKDLTDFIIKCIDENPANDKPFFAYQAPNDPQAVPDEWRDKYNGQYDRGFDSIRKTTPRDPGARIFQQLNTKSIDLVSVLKIRSCDGTQCDFFIATDATAICSTSKKCVSPSHGSSWARGCMYSHSTFPVLMHRATNLAL